MGIIIVLVSGLVSNVMLYLAGTPSLGYLVLLASFITGVVMLVVKVRTLGSIDAAKSQIEGEFNHTFAPWPSRYPDMPSYEKRVSGYWFEAAVASIILSVVSIWWLEPVDVWILLLGMVGTSIVYNETIKPLWRKHKESRQVE